jgi:serpin B
VTLRSLDDGGWARVAAGLENGRVMVSMPRFTLEFETDLIKALQAMGIQAAFDPGLADFSRMSRGGGLFISEVKHKTFVDVNEEGTEAAAVTAVVIDRSAPPNFRVDRPFLFAIRERFSGTILFAGRIVEVRE